MPATRRSWMRRSPRAADHLRAESAFALSLSIRKREAAAFRYGRSTDCFDKYLAGHESSPVFRAAELIIAVDNPEPLLAHWRIVAMRITENMTRAQLEARLEEIVTQLEPEAEARENTAALLHCRKDDADSRRRLRRAFFDEVQLQSEAIRILDVLAGKDSES